MLINDLNYFKRSSNYHKKFSEMDTPGNNILAMSVEDFHDYPIQDFDYQFNSWGFRGPEYKQYISNPVNICLGDSFTVNIGGPIEHSWCSKLAEHFDIPTINLGMDGAGNDAIKLVYNRACKLFDVQNTFVMYSFLHRRLINGEFRQEVYKDNENFEYFNPSLLFKFKRKILSKVKKKPFLQFNDYEKIYISRADALKKNNRYLKNNLEIEKFLSKSGFKILILSKYSFLEQAMIFNRAKVIIGLHGAGFANIVFSKKKTKIIEITYPRWPNNIEKLSKCMSLSYNKIMVTKIDKTTNTIDLSISKIQKYI